METAGAPTGRLGLCVLFALLVNGSTGLVCYTAVESLDLGCLLRWDCPHASPNATYTVQTKTQGDPWQDVSWCVWVSARTCDLSQAFSNFELYNMIRLGVHLSPSSTVWIQPRKFDYADFTFSPPSVSVSLRDERLLVKVQFPCAVSRRCSLEQCCPISELIDPWTTVTVCSTTSDSHCQSRTVWTQEVVTYVDFSGVAPGQNYCAVANFSYPTFSMAASAKSSPQCVETVSRSDWIFGMLLKVHPGCLSPGNRNLKGVMPVLGLGIGLTSMLLVPFVSVLLLRWHRAAPTMENPKPMASSHDPVSPVTLSLVPIDLCDIRVEFVDQISSESSSSVQSDQNQMLGNLPVSAPL